MLPTLFCNLYFTTAKFGLLDVLHAEVIAAVSVGLGFVSWGRLIVRAVGVGRGCEINEEHERLVLSEKKEGKTTKKKHAKETIIVNIQLKSCLCRLVS